MPAEHEKQTLTSALIFSVEQQQYALETASIRVIVPVLEMRKLPGVPDYVLGVITYRGEIVPVLDVTRMLCGKAAKLYYSTRIALVEYPLASGSVKLVGLLIEEAVQAIQEIAGGWKPAGIAMPDAPYLGGIGLQGERSVQLVKLVELLPRDVQELLFVS